MSTNECMTFLQKCVESILSPFTSQHQKSAELLAAERKLTSDELHGVQNSFASAVNGAQGACANRSQLMVMLPSCPGMGVYAQNLQIATREIILHLESLEEHLAERLYRILTGDDAGVTYERLLITTVAVLKGSSEGNANFMYELLSHAKGTDAQEQELRQNLHSLITWATGGNQGGRLSEALARGAVLSTEGRGFSSPEDFMKWCKGVPAIAAAVQSLLDFHGRDALSTSSKVPQPKYKKPRLLFSSSVIHTASLNDCLMDEALIWLLSSWVPPDQAEVWELLFNGQVNGASFNTFMGKAADKGPAMVLVRDKKGYLFGGYAAEGWSKHGQFYGSELSFIFGLLPTLVRYRASGANQNMLWCGQGFSQLPNGIGWGGKPGYFGLYVDSTFERGMSRPCSTYNSTCLAADEVFDVDVVECWLVKQPEETPPNQRKGGSASVLDKFKEDRNLMNLAGRGNQASAGIREAPTEDELQK